MACGAKVEIGHVNKFSLHTTKNVLMKNIYQQLQGESCALRPEMVGLASIWMFHLIAQLTKHFCQIPIGQDRTEHELKHQKFKIQVNTTQISKEMKHPVVI